MCDSRIAEVRYIYIESSDCALLLWETSLFRKVKIVVLDEATSNMDMRTDLQTQLAFRDTFAKQTLLLITHRVNNVADMDAILHVDEGNVAVERTREAEAPEPSAEAVAPQAEVPVEKPSTDAIPEPSEDQPSENGHPSLNVPE